MFKFPNQLKHGMRGFLALVFCLAYAAGAGAQSEKLRVGFLSAAPPDHPFWGQVVEVMQAAADDLNIELIIKYDPTRSTYATKRLGSQLIESGEKLDYMLTKYQFSVTATHIEQAQKRGTKVFVFNSDVPESDYGIVGRLPRQKYDNWIGHMVPDDTTAGYDLAGILIDHARQAGGDKNDTIHVLALDGPFESTVGKNRLAGMKNKIQETPDADLEDVVVTNWEAGAANHKIGELLQTYPKTNVLWAPNESITWGALQAVEHSGRSPGKDIQVGGFDWNSESIKAIADGRITASMFGHFLEGAWALILVHDYHYGYDFAESVGVRISTPLSAMTAKNYPQYKNLLQEGNWEKIDFKKLSKKYNPDLKSYNFNINQFLQ